MAVINFNLDRQDIIKFIKGLPTDVRQQCGVKSPEDAYYNLLDKLSGRDKSKLEELESDLWNEMFLDKGEDDDDSIREEMVEEIGTHLVKKGICGKKVKTSAIDLEAIWFDKEAKHPKGPMTEEEKEKLFEENPKFKEMNEEYGDVVKDKHNKKASGPYIAILLESTSLRGYALICPVSWLAYPEDAFYILQMNVKSPSPRAFKALNGKKYSVFYVDKGSNRKSLKDINSLHVDVNAIFELVDEGYLNNKCIQAFQ